MAFHLKILKTSFTLECFDRNWPSDSGEEDENAKSFRTEYMIRKGLLSSDELKYDLLQYEMKLIKLYNALSVYTPIIITCCTP